METVKKGDCSRVYKLTFKDGSTHYGRVVLSKQYSASTYLKDTANRARLNSRNPLRVNMTTFVEKRLAVELETTKCEIVYEGLTSEAIKIKDGLSLSDSNSLNMRTNVEMGVRKDIVKLPKKYSKVLRSVGGEVVNYISSSYARTHDLVQYLNETKRHPLDNTFTQILIPVERI
jgi:hypothetical protein